MVYNEEILALSKVLLESIAFPKEEIDRLLEKLMIQSLPANRKHIEEVIRNERFHYMPLTHNRYLLKTIWDISEAVRTKRKLQVTYRREKADGHPSNRTVLPVGIIFSEYYFYLAAYIEKYGFDFPTIYRLDRIEDYSLQNDHFKIPESERFEEGEFRKRIQFMKPVKLMRLQFHFSGPSLEAVLDRLPTAKVISSDQQGTLIEAEVFGNGIKMWLLSQAQYLKVLKPDQFQEEMEQTIATMLQRYRKEARGRFSCFL